MKPKINLVGTLSESLTEQLKKEFPDCTYDDVSVSKADGTEKFENAFYDFDTPLIISSSGNTPIKAMVALFQFYTLWRLQRRTCILISEKGDLLDTLMKDFFDHYRGDLPECKPEHKTAYVYPEQARASFHDFFSPDDTTIIDHLKKCFVSRSLKTEYKPRPNEISNDQLAAMQKKFPGTDIYASYESYYLKKGWELPPPIYVGSAANGNNGWNKITKALPGAIKELSKYESKQDKVPAFSVFGGGCEGGRTEDGPQKALGQEAIELGIHYTGFYSPETLNKFVPEGAFKKFPGISIILSPRESRRIDIMSKCSEITLVTIAPIGTLFELAFIKFLEKPAYLLDDPEINSGKGYFWRIAELFKKFDYELPVIYYGDNFKEKVSEMLKSHKKVSLPSEGEAKSLSEQFKSLMPQQLGESKVTYFPKKQKLRIYFDASEKCDEFRKYFNSITSSISGCEMKASTHKIKSKTGEERHIVKITPIDQETLKTLSSSDIFKKYPTKGSTSTGLGTKQALFSTTDTTVTTTTTTTSTTTNKSSPIITSSEFRVG